MKTKSIFHKESMKDDFKPLCGASLRPVSTESLDSTTLVSSWVNCEKCIAISETLKSLEQENAWIEA